MDLQARDAVGAEKPDRLETRAARTGKRQAGEGRIPTQSRSVAEPGRVD